MRTKYWWVILIIIFLGVNVLASLFHFRIDLTEEKRFTLSSATKNLLRDLTDPVTVTVFLDGSMPAGFRKLSNSAEEILQEFREAGANNVIYRFSRPGSNLDDSSRMNFLVYLDSMGLSATNVQVQSQQGESQEAQLLHVGAMLQYRDRQTVIDFLKGQAAGGEGALNNAEALLEYKFASAIQRLTLDSVPVIGYLLGNGQPTTYNFVDLVDNTLRKNYRFGFLPIDSVKLIPPFFNLLFVVKPTQPFNDEQKLKLDQYVMQGGKVIWMIDNLYAEMDSLMRRQSDFVAFDRGLNLDDLLFKYGARINKDLVQDLQCDLIPQVVGAMGGQPQIELLRWPYFPLLSSYTNHPISKNLDQVLSIFPNSIDTIKTPGIKKTVLLATSKNTRTLKTPAIVSFNSLKNEEDIQSFNQSHLPIAVLLEGSFNSLYSNRISAGMRDTMAKVYNQPFRSSSVPNKMIVISDADIVANVVSQNRDPRSTPMGWNQFTDRTYANKEFVLNAVEYLVNPSGILETRAKDYTLRLLDPAKVDESKTFWQVINLALPAALIIAFGLLFQFLRKRQYQRAV